MGIITIDGKAFCESCKKPLVETGIANGQSNTYLVWGVELVDGELEYSEKPEITLDDGDNEMLCADCGGYLDIWDEQLAKALLEGKTPEEHNEETEKID